MYSQLCDRCLLCAHEILIKYDFKTKFNDKDEVFNYITHLLSYINDDNNYIPLNVSYESENLNYGFLNDFCPNCLNINNDVRKSIRMYLKIYIVDQIFKCVIENEFRENFLKNEHFKQVIRKKLITFHISIKENSDMLYYFNQNLINYKDLKNIPYFKELDNLSKYYKSIFKIPIYIANIDTDVYTKRKELNLAENIKKHPLCYTESC